MVIDMNEAQLQTLAQIREFMAGTADVPFTPKSGRQERYEFVARTLRRLGWACHRRPDKGLLKAYFGKMTGLSRAQVTRLIAQYCQSGTVQARYQPPATAWRGRFTAEDCSALAELDSLHDTLSGPAARHLCHRAWTLYGDARYERLATEVRHFDPDFCRFRGVVGR